MSPTSPARSDLAPAPPVDPRTIEILERLIAFDSTSARSNLPLVDWTCDRLDSAGAGLERWTSADGRKAGLIARFGPEVDPAERAGLVLSGHTDVVPAREDGWKGDPFSLRDAGDRWIARGSCDMKGFLAAAMRTAETVRAETLRAPLVLLLTYDEEVGSLGAQELVAQRSTQHGTSLILPRAMVIGEPTSLGVVSRHKGHLRLRVSVAGRAAHSGFPDRGESAIEPAAEIIVALKRLRRELVDERSPSSQHFPHVPYPALHVGTIQGGSAVNVIPDRCTLEIGVRLLPGLDVATLEGRIRDTILGASGAPVEVGLERVNLSPALETGEASPIVRHLLEVAGVPAATSASFSSDGGWLSELDVDAVLWGPGSIEVAHRPEEFLPKAELGRCLSDLDRLVERFCRESGR